MSSRLCVLYVVLRFVHVPRMGGVARLFRDHAVDGASGFMESTLESGYGAQDLRRCDDVRAVRGLVTG